MQGNAMGLGTSSSSDRPAVASSLRGCQKSAISLTSSCEAAGIFGNATMPELLTMEGNYTFHFRATYGDTCTATRELLWSLHVDPGVDPSRTTVTTTLTGGTGSITLVPKDKYGNNLGPG